MAGGLNSSFKKNPTGFMTSHDLIVSPQAIGSRALHGPTMNMDLVMADKNSTPKAVRMEDYDLRGHSSGASALACFFCPATLDNSESILINPTRKYAFTPDLSGCLFAAYGATRNNLTLEHVNVRTPNAVVAIAPRLAAILALNQNVTFILSPVPPAGGVGNATVVHYTLAANVVGVRGNNGWSFHYKRDGNAVQTF